MVLDINLSDGSGIELQHELAAAGITLPVVYITGNDDDATRHSAMKWGPCLLRQAVRREISDRCNQQIITV
jgi:FixJ family two-component response regulator